jgi:hypothetical protein
MFTSGTFQKIVQNHGVGKQLDFLLQTWKVTKTEKKNQTNIFVNGSGFQRLKSKVYNPTEKLYAHKLIIFPRFYHFFFHKSNDLFLMK